MIRSIRSLVRNKGWSRPSAEERAEHVRTLERLGQLVVDRSDPIPVWFVLMSGFEGELGAVQSCDRAG